MNMKPYVLTVGEPAGIGPDCVLLAFQAQPEIFRNIVIIAKHGWLTSRAKVLGLTLSISECTSSFERDVSRNTLWVFDPTDDETREVIVGKPSIKEAEAVVSCIRIAA
ncbi:MAG: 4-hydroxythreonine-4-phosphate dehydrogenase PdxA, partial [Ghiorsea sp.]|nr:4-hydroxythreonine-4-phosphate dehydrogenase PdxA [Ghiorsea sp.]